MFGDQSLALDHVGAHRNAAVHVLEIRCPAVDQPRGSGMAECVVGKCAFGETCFAVDGIRADRAAGQTFTQRRVGADSIVEQIQVPSSTL